MLCLSCGHDEESLDPRCSQCEAVLGYVAEGGGYLPQLRQLEQALQLGQLDEETAQLRLQRASEALDLMLQNLDECGAGLMSLGLDDVQQGTLGGFLTPLRQGLQRLMDLMRDLDPGQPWDSQAWAELEQAQNQVFQANQGLISLTQALMGFAQEQQPVS